ncbi:MAG: response regulator, partial [Euryarchaeota archaeon]|nr:response regulator [Euryarchaeota archaeon]
QVLEIILKNEGFEVHVANNGSEAVEKAKELKPDLILMDVMMPEMDGWEACRRIKTDPETKDILVAMLTVKSQDENKVKSLDEAKADWHIAKPVRAQRLVQTVNWLLDSPLQREDSD